MKSVKIFPGKLSGTVGIPPSKSAAHRAVICAALAKGKSVLSPIALSDDIRATIAAVRAIGAKCEINGDVLTVDGSETFSVNPKEIDCIESGSTLRFMIPVCAAGGAQTTFVGQGRLPQRPIGVYGELLPSAGVTCINNGGLPFSVSGQLQPGTFTLSGNISSQFITGLMLALPLLNGDSRIRLSTPLESEGYIDLTIAVMKSFGVEVKHAENGWDIRGGQSYLPGRQTVEGDWSQAAFYFSAAALGSALVIGGLDPDSAQGDRAALGLFENFGMNCRIKNGLLECKPSGQLHSQKINVSQIPDLVPALAVTAAFANGVTEITGAKRLRLKESDRLACVAQGLRRMGCKVNEAEDSLTIYGGSPLSGAEIDGCNDHRIVMAFTVAALHAKGATTITDAQSVNKSYPDFFKIITELGGIVNVI